LPVPPGVDPFAPRMPDVDIVPDITALFARARSEIASGGPDKGLEAGQRCIGVLTPGRILAFVPAPKPGAMSPLQVAQAKSLVVSDKPLKITAVAFTEITAFHQDKAKAMPLLGQLLAMAYVGHSVVVFEGHESVFENALRDTDVLVVDSGMVACLQSDWLDTVERVMGQKPRVLGHDRESHQLRPIARSSKPPGWRFTEADGELSYVNCLLTTLAKSPRQPVKIDAGQAPPDLTRLAADAGTVEWASALPFRYDALSADKVMGVIHRLAKWEAAKESRASGRLETKLAAGGSLQRVGFQLLLVKDADGKYHLEIEKAE